MDQGWLVTYLLSQADIFTVRFKMKPIRILSLLTTIMVIAMTGRSFVNADMNAQSIVDKFNNASGGTTMQFMFSMGEGLYKTGEAQVKQIGSGFADASAYAQSVTGGSDYYRTFCVQPEVSAHQYMEAKLNYVDGKSTTTSGHSLTLGAAYLYTQFATGVLEGYDYTDTTDGGTRVSSSVNLLVAIRACMDITVVSNWAANPFLKQLLLIDDDRENWMGLYDPNQYYDIIGDYSVFVMNNTEIGTGQDGQDFLYLAKTPQTPGEPGDPEITEPPCPGTDAPEPTTLLLWGLGSLGVFGYAKKRKGIVKE